MPGYTLSQFSIFDKFRDFVPWNSLDGYTIWGDVGYVVFPYGTCVELTTDGDTDDEVELYTEPGWVKLLQTGKVVTVEFVINNLDSITNQEIYIRIWGLFSGEYLGWYIDGKDLYVANYDGATEKLTDTGVDLEADMQRTRLKMVFDPGHDIKFYVNDVLKVTHTENLPTPDLDDFYAFCCYVQTKENAAKSIYLERVLLEREL